MRRLTRGFPALPPAGTIVHDASAEPLSCGDPHRSFTNAGWRGLLPGSSHTALTRTWCSSTLGTSGEKAVTLSLTYGGAGHIWKLLAKRCVRSETERHGTAETVRTLYALRFTLHNDIQGFLFRNFGPENPKNMVINNQS